jgi:hypothetical protein
MQIITKWRWRGNDIMLSKLSQEDYPTEKDIPRIRKYMKEHPEEGIVDKESFYKIHINEILELIKASQKDYSGTLI